MVRGLLAVLLSGSSLAAQPEPAPLATTCGAVMAALVRHGARSALNQIDPQYGHPEQIYYYHHAPYKIDFYSVVRQKNGNFGNNWRAVIDCQKPIRPQLLALRLPVPVPGLSQISGDKK